MIIPEFERGVNLIRSPRTKVNIPLGTLPVQNSKPVEHSTPIGYVHSTAHSSETGNNGSKKKLIKQLKQPMDRIYLVEESKYNRYLINKHLLIKFSI